MILHDFSCIMTRRFGYRPMYVSTCDPSISPRAFASDTKWAMRLVDHFITFSNAFDKLNNTEIRLINFIYHMAFYGVYGVKPYSFCHTMYTRC